MSTNNKSLKIEASFDEPIVQSTPNVAEIPVEAPVRVIEIKDQAGEPSSTVNLFLPSHLYSVQGIENRHTLYSGPTKLIFGGIKIIGHGEVTMRLSPSVDVAYHVESDEIPFTIAMAKERKATLEMTAINENLNVDVASSHISSTGGNWVRGSVNVPASFGKVREDGKPESLGRVRFHLLNFHNYHGDLLFACNRPMKDAWHGRVRTIFGPWILTLDAQPDVKARHDYLGESQGCTVTHLGDIRRVDFRLFSRADADDVLSFLYWLLTFANGARTGCVLAAGFRHLDWPLWHQWSAQKTEQGVPSANWFPQDQPHEGLAIATKAWEIWSSKDKQDWFKRAIAIYADCTRNVSGTEIELAKAQIVLELLTWVVLCEERSTISDDGLSKLQAADRLRLLLSWSGIPLAIPSHLVRLTGAFAGISGADGPHVVTEIRNSAIHPTKKNLKKLHDFDLLVRFEAWWLSVWYVELVLLRLFHYNGPYHNRLILPGWRGQTEQVPWA